MGKAMMPYSFSEGTAKMSFTNDQKSILFEYVMFKKYTVFKKYTASDDNV